MKKIKEILTRLLLSRAARERLAEKALKERILRYYSAVRPEDIPEDIDSALRYLRRKPLRVFPADFSDDYHPDKIKVFTDPGLKLKYILFEGKRLYFKKRSSVNSIRRAAANLLREQDIRSPHRYTTQDFRVGDRDIIADIGAAEGIFTLSVIEKIDRAFLFETDEEWIEALNATFAPWKDKVKIINRYVSDADNDMCLTLDGFFPDSRLDFIKADVEGAEERVIKGAAKLIARQSGMKIAICCYHRQDDEAVLSALLKNHGFSLSVPEGHMLFPIDKEQKPPYFRRGLIRAEKSA